MKNRKTRSAMRRMLFTLALVLVVAVASVGGTIAWLTDKTAPVTNTFTVGDINIELTETERTYKIVPGVEIPKDPKVTVKANSEACWLFVKVEEANWLSAMESDTTTRKVKYDIADGWQLVPEQTNVYYREVNATTADADFAVLKGNKVTVSENLTKNDIKDITTNPTLTFTAYAIQKEGFDTAAAAWAEASK